MMLITVIGMPHCGADSFSRALAAETGLELLRAAEVMGGTSTPPTTAMIRAHDLMRQGHLLPAALRATLWAEAVARSPKSILYGFPREEPELLPFEAQVHVMPIFVHIVAPIALVDERRRAAGLGPIEVHHPGAFERLQAMYEPVLRRAAAVGNLLELDAAEPTPRLVEATLARFFSSGSRRIL